MRILPTMLLVLAAVASYLVGSYAATTQSAPRARPAGGLASLAPQTPSPRPSPHAATPTPAGDRLPATAAPDHAPSGRALPDASEGQVRRCTIDAAPPGQGCGSAAPSAPRTALAGAGNAVCSWIRRAVSLGMSGQAGIGRCVSATTLSGWLSALHLPTAALTHRLAWPWCGHGMGDRDDRARVAPGLDYLCGSGSR